MRYVKVFVKGQIFVRNTYIAKLILLSTFFKLWSQTRKKLLNKENFLTRCAGILVQSMEARNQVGIGFSFRPARLHWLTESINWNQFLGPLKVYKFWLRFRYIFGHLHHSLSFTENEALLLYCTQPLLPHN